MARMTLVVCLAGMVGAGSACVTNPKMGGQMAQDVESPIILFPAASGCGLSAKEPSITAHPDKRLEFEVSNYCGQPQKLVVGNFRTVESPSPAPAHCNEPTYGGAPSVFQQDDLPRRTASLGAGSPGHPTHTKIKLKIKKNADLPGTGPLTYYFDVCLNDVKVDPRLILQR